jgi:Uma2 family endonuclease
LVKVEEKKKKKKKKILKFSVGRVWLIDYFERLLLEAFNARKKEWTATWLSLNGNETCFH